LVSQDRRHLFVTPWVGINREPRETLLINLSLHLLVHV
jgi:hypothetical protein